LYLTPLHFKGLIDPISYTCIYSNYTFIKLNVLGGLTQACYVLLTGLYTHNYYSTTKITYYLSTFRPLSWRFQHDSRLVSDLSK